MSDTEWKYQGKRRAQVAFSLQIASICFALMVVLSLIGACYVEYVPTAPPPMEKAIRHTGRMDTLWVTP